MRFKIDENLPVAVAELCNELGHNTITVAEQSLGGKSDTEIATACRFEKRALVTLDVDFADIRTYPPEDFYGLIVLRLNNQAQPHVLETVRRLLPILSKEPLERRLWIVEEHRVRIRE